MSKKELAAQYHASGCNCAMAVGCAFCDKAGVSEDEMKALTRRYGGGAHKYCGALLGAVAAMNMASGQLNKDDPAVLDGKASDKAAELLRRFEAKNGSVFCRELKGRDTGVVLRPCRGCVEDAAELGRIERYVEMALVYLRLDSESSDYVIRELDPFIRRSVKKFAGEFISKRLSLELEPSGASVVSDEKWLAFVVEQVLSNSLKYTREGSVRIYLAEPKTLCIRDTGIGIAPEDMPRIFDKGYTGLNGRADLRASGLGLYLCRRVCRKLGHGISAVSAPGEGTEIRIDLSSYDLDPE